MKRRYRRGFCTAEKTELWDRWQRGESLRAIGRVFGKPSSSIYFQLAPYGGIRPAPRRRSRLALSLSDREEIPRGVTAQPRTPPVTTSTTVSPPTSTTSLPTFKPPQVETIYQERYCYHVDGKTTCSDVR